MIALKKYISFFLIFVHDLVLSLVRSVIFLIGFW